MALEIQAAEKPRSIWPFVLIGAVIVIIVVAVLLWAGGKTSPQAVVPQPLPFGAAEQAYAPGIKFGNLKLSRFANMFDQEVTYVDGEVTDSGNRTVADMQVNFEFLDLQNKVVHSETVRLLGRYPQPIPPGGKQSFHIGFEQIPATWNVQNPTMRVTGLRLK